MNTKHTLIMAIAIVVALASRQAATAQDAPRKLAFIVGVSQYKKDGLENLKYAHKDAADLASALKGTDGFEVTLVTQKNATQASVTKKLEAFFEQTRNLGKNDVALISFSGHGVQSMVKENNRQVETPFFCVYDTLVSDHTSMISLNWVLEKLKDSGCSNNLLIVDACRNNPTKGARTLDGSTVRELPTKISILFSSSPGRQSFESDKVKQGIFTHVLLDGLKGAARNSRNEVDWLRLAAHTVSEVPRIAGNLAANPDVIQRPNLVGNTVNSPVLVRNVRKIRPLKLRFPFSEREAIDVQSKWADYLDTEPVIRANNGHEMVLIPPGEFMMGNEESPDAIMKRFSFLKNIKKSWLEDAPAHRVEITRSFWMSSTEVTVGQFRAFVEATGYKTEAEKDGEGGWGYDSELKKSVGRKTKYSWKNTGWNQSDRHPVVNVTWNDAMAYCRWLSKQTGEKYGLPTEAQWEYASRGGTSTGYHFGDDPQELVRFENTWDASTKEKYPTFINQLSGSDRQVFSSAVGRYRGNPFGLHDMHGNVREWCSDWYGENYYDVSPVGDPTGPKSGSSRVLRGGSWSVNALYCRSAHRHYLDPPFRFYFIGFRVVLVR